MRLLLIPGREFRGNLLEKMCTPSRICFQYYQYHHTENQSRYVSGYLCFVVPVLQLTITIFSQYHIDKGDLTWATVFKKLEENKEQLCIEDYSVSQTTLEQVFINFARAQVPPDDEKPSLGRRIKQTCCICCVPEYVVANNVPIKGPGSHRNGEATAYAGNGHINPEDPELNMVNGKAVV